MGSLSNGRPYIREHSGVMTMPEYSEYSAVTFAVVANAVRLQVTGITETQLKALVDKYILADNGAETSQVRLVNEIQIVDGTPDTYFVVINEPFTVAAASYDLLYVDPINAQFVNTVIAGTEDVYVDGEAVVLAGEAVTFEPAEPYRPLVLFSDYPYRLSNGFFFDLGGGGAGGGVQSVSAENASIVVDNTDPLNPVVGLPYLVYRALLTQTSGDAPTAVVLENTLGEVPTFGYTGDGSYTLNVTGNIFVEGKTHISYNPFPLQDFDSRTFQAFKAADNQVTLFSKSSGSGANDLLTNIELTILIYP